MNNTEQEMIQVQDLRVYNIVMVEGCYCTVLLIDAATRQVHLQSFSQKVSVNILEPVKLTSSMLYEIGFVRCTCNGWKFMDNGKVFFHLGENFSTKYGPVIESLHQLQNLYFALTQTELEIKLF